MKAVYINETGGTDVLGHCDRPDPEISPGEVVLRFHASSLNQFSSNLRAGKCLPLSLHSTLGLELLRIDLVWSR